METGQANVFGDDLEPATVSDEMGDNFSIRMRQQSATAHHISLESSHTTQQHCLTAGVCWKMLLQGAGVLPLVLGVLSIQDWYDVREEEYATWHDPGWPD
jgi:hypothetical protein